MMKLHNFIILCLIFFIYSNIKAQDSENFHESVFIEDSICSKSLGQTRKYFIYLPENFDKAKTYDIIFTTDGQFFYGDNYINSIDSIVASDIITPIIIIGVYSNNNLTPNGMNFTYRQLEYIEDYDNKIFEDHYIFFTKELVDSVSAKYEINFDNNNKTFYGYSNGASFGLSIFFKNRSLFKNYILFSPLGFNTSRIHLNQNQNNTMLIAYGEKEIQPLQENYKELLRVLDLYSYEYQLLTFDGGHDRKQWKKLLIDVISELYHYQ